MSVAAYLKQDALDAIVRLPDNANMDQFMYRLRLTAGYLPAGYHNSILPCAEGSSATAVAEGL